MRNEPYGVRSERNGAIELHLTRTLWADAPNPRTVDRKPSLELLDVDGSLHGIILATRKDGTWPQTLEA